MSADSPGAGIDAVFVVLTVVAIVLAGLRGVRAIRAADERRALVAARVLASGLVLIAVAGAVASALIALVGSGRAAGLGPVEVGRGFVVVLGQPKGPGIVGTEITEQLHQLYGPALGLDLNSTLRVMLDPSLADQLMAWALFVSAVVAIALPLELIRRILARAAAGLAFTRETVRLVDALAAVIGLGWLVLVPIQRALTGQLLSHAGATAGFRWPDVTTEILVGLALFALGRIWREALPAHEREPARAVVTRVAAVPPAARP
ncbi:MAG: hypothetical protein J7513_03480 [Solirubrobacteraceae bacterium]|nr:hypothetical protein [Solirubrobacteraceae bacterium]